MISISLYSFQWHFGGFCATFTENLRVLHEFRTTYYSEESDRSFFFTVQFLSSYDDHYLTAKFWIQLLEGKQYLICCAKILLDIQYDPRNTCEMRMHGSSEFSVPQSVRDWPSLRLLWLFTSRHSFSFSGLTSPAGKISEKPCCCFLQLSIMVRIL